MSTKRRKRAQRLVNSHKGRYNSAIQSTFKTKMFSNPFQVGYGSKEAYHDVGSWREPSSGSSIPSYLDARMANLEALTIEKRYYLAFLGNLVKALPFNSKQAVSVLGVGPGLECLEIARALATREDRGEETPLFSLDIRPEILEALRERTDDPKITSGITLGDACNLPNPPFADNSSGLVVISSVLHEIFSRYGWSGIETALKEAGRIVAPGGYLLFREFYPPLPGRQIIELKTSVAKRFFAEFDRYFPLIGEKAQRKSWSWLTPKEKFVITNQFAFELLLHFRMFCKNLYQLQGEKAFDGFSQWQELNERYALKRPGHPLSPDDIMDGIRETLAGPWRSPLANYASIFFVFPDRDDLPIVKEHFEWRSTTGNGPSRMEFNRLCMVFCKLEPTPEGLDPKTRKNLLIDQSFAKIGLITEVFAKTRRNER